MIVEIKAEDKEQDQQTQNKKKAVEYLEGIEENKFKYVVIYTNEQIEDNNKDFLEVEKLVASK